MLATAAAEQTALTRAFRSGKPVAVVGDGATAALGGLLDRVREDYSFGGDGPGAARECRRR